MSYVTPDGYVLTVASFKLAWTGGREAHATESEARQTPKELATGWPYVFRWRHRGS